MCLVLEYLKKRLPSKDKFYISLAKELVIKTINTFQKFGIILERLLSFALKIQFFIVRFKNNVQQNYELYFSHLLSKPALSWDAMLSINLFQKLTCTYLLK